jgi:ParB-like chromosome segregation protein Spo0J
MTDWPADKVERRQVASLTPYARNARTHSPAQISQIAASVTEWGWTTPVLIDEQGGLIAGHGRVLAAQQLGLDTVPVMVARGWSKAQKRAYVLADNKLTLNGGFDDELLRLELADLKDEGFDIGLTGFSGDELDALLITEEDADPAAQGEGGAGSLSDKFGLPPFSVLNAREGWWQERKRAWLAMGIKSELGRGDTAVNTPHHAGGSGRADFAAGGTESVTQSERHSGGQQCR